MIAGSFSADIPPSRPHRAMLPSILRVRRIKKIHPPVAVRESLLVQSRLATIGERRDSASGFHATTELVSLPKYQRHIMGAFVEELPFNYDESTISTIEQIDVLWLRGRRILRAFEVEHTTAIDSGSLRMGDLLSLQLQIQIKLHIVAPDDRSATVMRNITRPILSVLEAGPLSRSCSYLSYSSADQLSRQPHLTHMTDTVLETFEEFAGDE